MLASPLPSTLTPAGPTTTLPCCSLCAPHLSRREAGYCPRCGEPAAWAERTPTLCAACVSGTEYSWRRFLFHGLYQGLLRECILRLKHSQELPLAHALGTLLARHPELDSATSSTYDAVVPVSLHPPKLRVRGFNQALELARPLAAAHAWPLKPQLLRRTLNTVTQATLHIADRRQNVRAAFTAEPQASGLRILLIDDVATTGSTLEAAAAALVQAGAAHVDVAVIARTPSARAKVPQVVA